MQFTLHVADISGNPTNTYYRYEIRIRNVEELTAAVRFDHMAARCIGNYRNKNNWKETDCILADSDNDDTDDPSLWVTPEYVASVFPEVAFYYVKSRNCYKVKHEGEPGEKSARPRYHYYFPLKVTLRDKKIANRLPRLLKRDIPAFDGAALDIVRFFYGYQKPQPEGGYVEGKYDIMEYFSADLQKEEEKEVVIPPEPTHENISDEFLEINLKDILKSIPADDESTWSFVCSCLKSIDEGLYDAFNKWSASSPKYYQKDSKGRVGGDMTAAKWNKSKKVGKEYGKASMIKVAQSYGWKPDDKNLTGEYKARHDAAERKKKALAEATRTAVDDLKDFGIDTQGMNVSDLMIIRRVNGTIKRVVHVVTGEVWEGGNE